MANLCVQCRCSDDDTELGWSLCGKCFRTDQFNGMEYWAPLLCGLVFGIGLCFLVAAVFVLAGIGPGS